MTLKLFIDYLSQPSRAVLIVFQMLKIPFEINEIRISQAQNRTPEFEKINITKKVPAILDDDFGLSESHAIMRYIIRSRNIQTNLYPLNDIQLCAKIDQYLDFHHTNTRKCSTWLFNKAFAPKLGVPVLVDIEQAYKETLSVLKFIDTKLLSQNKYLCGDLLTIADISAYCEIVQTRLLDLDLTKYKNLNNWMKNMEQIPEVKESHKPFVKIFQKMNPNAKL